MSKHSTAQHIGHYKILSRIPCAVTNLNSILKSRDITFPTKVHMIKALVFPEGFPGSLDGKASAYNVGDPGTITKCHRVQTWWPNLFSHSPGGWKSWVPAEWSSVESYVAGLQTATFSLGAHRPSLCKQGRKSKLCKFSGVLSYKGTNLIVKAPPP